MSMIKTALPGAAGAASTPAVEVTGLRKAFGSTPVLHDVGLRVEPGSITAILGSSGSGKTTLLRLLAGFERPDAGSIRIGDRPVDRVPPEHRRIGYVPQDGALFPHLTVHGNIAFALRRGERRGGRVERLLDLIGLTGPDGTDLGHRYPHELSGGQQQRVALARALAHDPAVVLLDEPFSALDAALRASVRTEIIAVLRAAGTTAILVTHDQDEALSLADRVAVLRDGAIVQEGTAQELYDTPADPLLAGFVGDANLISGRFLDGGRVEAGPLGVLEVRAERSAAPAAAAGDSSGASRRGDALVLIRPEQFTVVYDGRPAVEAQVERCEYFGHDTMLTVRPLAAGTGLPGLLYARLPEGVRMSPGETVGLAVRGPVAAWGAAV
jgi:iron(III) transport system ATP-binding protein